MTFAPGINKTGKILFVICLKFSPPSINPELMIEGKLNRTSNMVTCIGRIRSESQDCPVMKNQ